MVDHHGPGASPDWLRPVGGDQFQKSINWLQNIDQWDKTTVAVSVAVIVFMVLLKRIRPIEKFAPIIVLVAATAIVNLLKIQTELVGDIATIPNSLPTFMLPDFSLIPQLAWDPFSGVGGAGAGRGHQHGGAQP